MTLQVGHLRNSKRILGMTGKRDKESVKDTEVQIRSAISAFEHILDAMPGDRASLWALSHAYEQIGDHDRARDCLIRLGNILVDDVDVEAATSLLGRIEPYCRQDERARDLAERIRKLAPEAQTVIKGSGVKAEPAKSRATVVEGLGTRFDMSTELAVAWNLMEAGMLNQEDYASVVQDLTDMWMGDNAATVSVLHVLEAKGVKNLEAIITFVSRQCGVPVISLAKFELQPEAISLLPIDFATRRGVLIFDLLGADALAITMNPYDTQLKKDVEVVSGRKCHFFVALPSEFDEALNRIGSILEMQKLEK